MLFGHDSDVGTHTETLTRNTDVTLRMLQQLSIPAANGPLPSKSHTEIL